MQIKIKKSDLNKKESNLNYKKGKNEYNLQNRIVNYSDKIKKVEFGQLKFIITLV